MELHLASMQNITCWAFRKLCAGATDSYTGMMSMSYLTERTKAWKDADFFPIENNRQWLQLLTSKETECKEFLSRLNKELSQTPEKSNLYGLQLNASCPSPNVINAGQGAALIKRPKRIADIIRELLKQDKFKVSLKIRIGMNEDDVRNKVLLNVFKELEKIKDKNFSHVVVHFKHAKSPSASPYDYSLLDELTKFNIPIIINGGISGLNDFNRIMKLVKEKKNIKGFMIARAALENPDCFVPINNMINKTQVKQRTKEEINGEFQELIKLHPPRDIFLRTIKEYCLWFK